MIEKRTSPAVIITYIGTCINIDTEFGELARPDWRLTPYNESNQFETVIVLITFSKSPTIVIVYIPPERSSFGNSLIYENND